jgi:hypothetical protein
MKKGFFCFLGLFFILIFSCLSSSEVMTMTAFYDVPLGTKKADLIKEWGKPYSVCKRSSQNTEELEYIEKITMGQRMVSERHYYFLLRNDAVVSKRMEEKEPFILDRNAIDIQSSMNF